MTEMITCESYIDQTTRHLELRPGYVTYGSIGCNRCKLTIPLVEFTGRSPEGTVKEFRENAESVRLRRCPILNSSQESSLIKQP